MAISFAVVANSLAVALAYVLYRAIRKVKTLPYPPGPKGHWLFGNVHDVPTERQWIAYKRMSEELGAVVYPRMRMTFKLRASPDSPVVHLSVLGTHIIVINDASTAYEIFEKRTANYSDRPRMLMVNEVAGFAWNFGFRGYDEHWKACRRYFDSYFRESASKKLRPQELAATHMLLHRLLETPEEFLDHFRFHSVRLILDLGYGIEVNDNDNYYIQVATTAIRVLGQTSGKHLVDVLPWIQYFPAWLPGMGWKARTVDWKKHSLAMRDEPFNAVKNGISTNSCMVSKFLDDGVAGDAKREIIARSTAGTLFSGGSHTVVNTLSFFLLAMLIFPDVQRKAHEELDQVIGKERLPDFEDKKSLPYIQAVCFELLRWSSLVPMALPHRAMEDDVWVAPNGKQYLIPQGAIVFGNSWAILRDSAVYPDPEEFKPERFLNNAAKIFGSHSGTKSPDAAFGYGGRLCAARWAAEDILFISIASILSAFIIEPTAKDQIWVNDYDALVTSDWMMDPHPFKCSISPRHENAESLIRDAEFSSQATCI
ncbi:cytochrome P450 [Flagelloscypha sp. PMI_526]|nr:cytochrome P450 [Flagelloscypha sp. PMI_526]